MSKIDEIQDFYLDYKSYELEEDEAEKLLEFCEEYGIEFDNQGIADVIIDDVKAGMDIKQAIEIIAADHQRSADNAVFKAVFFESDMSDDINESVREDKKNLYKTDTDTAIKQGHTNKEGDPIWRKEEADNNPNREPGELVGERYVKRLIGFGYPVEEGGNITEEDKKVVKPLTIESWQDNRESLENFTVPENPVEFEASGPNTESKYRLYHSGATQMKETQLDGELEELISDMDGMSPAEIIDKIQDTNDDFGENNLVAIRGKATNISESQSGDKNIILRAAGDMVSARVSGVSEADFGVNSEVVVLGEPWIPEDNVGKEKGVVLVVSDHYYIAPEERKGPENVDMDEMEEKAKQTVETDGTVDEL